MRIVVATSEAVPFAKTGGLADVCGALPVELARMGHHVAVIMPAYRTALDAGVETKPTDVKLEIEIGAKRVPGSIRKAVLPASAKLARPVDVYLVDQPQYFDRKGLYQEQNVDYIDNCERFVFFCRAVLEFIRLSSVKPDVLHLNDWQTGLIPAYLDIEYRDHPGFEQLATLFTIHNLAYQGHFWHWDMLLTGLDWKYFNWRQMEFYGHLNLMKTGLVFADSINTVSPRYADEIQSDPLGCGLDGVLRGRSDVLSGIINGVDYEIWNPSSDPHLAQTFDAKTAADGKCVCKAALQDEMRLPLKKKKPLIGFIGRLVEQKGIDLVVDVLKRWSGRHEAQWVILGTGHPDYEQALIELANHDPKHISVRLAFSDALAHRIEAGADMFVMPSRYEPCGLNQLFSLRYGTVPIVRETGGLADTVTDLNHVSRAKGNATGFSFRDFNSLAFEQALVQALETYKREKSTWAKLVSNGMQQDWSWAKSAREYVALYETTIARRRAKQSVSV